MLTGYKSIVHPIHSLVSSLRHQIQAFNVPATQAIHENNNCNSGSGNGYYSINVNNTLCTNFELNNTFGNGIRIVDTNCNITDPTIIDINNADCRVGNFRHNNATYEIPNFNITNCNETTNNVVNNDLLQHNNTCNIMEVENINLDNEFKQDIKSNKILSTLEAIIANINGKLYLIGNMQKLPKEKWVNVIEE